MMNGELMKQAMIYLDDAMHELGRNVDAAAIGDIVVQHAFIGAASGAAAAIAPGAGALAAVGIAGTAVCAMYIRIAAELGVTLKEGALKALASGVVADLSATVAANIALSAAISFIPGVGSMSSSVLSAIGNYGMVYLAALIFIKMLAALLRSGKDPSDMGDDELKAAAAKAADGVNMKAAMKEAKNEYKKNQ